MSEYEGFTSNMLGLSTKRRIPIAFCVEVSSSMASPMGSGSTKIDELNRVFKDFIYILENEYGSYVTFDTAVVTFGDKVKIEEPFSALKKMHVPNFKATESPITPMGEALSVSLMLLKLRQEAYRERGIRYLTPWLVVFADGEPFGSHSTVEFEKTLRNANELEKKDKLVVINIAVGNDDNFNSLRRLSICNKEPFKLDELIVNAREEHLIPIISS